MDPDEIKELKEQVKTLNDRLEVLKYRYTVKNADFFCITESSTNNIYILNSTMNVKDFLCKNTHKIVYAIYTPGTKLINAFIKTHFDNSLYCTGEGSDWPINLRAPLHTITKPIERILNLLSIKYEPIPQLDLINLIFTP